MASIVIAVALGIVVLIIFGAITDAIASCMVGIHGRRIVPAPVIEPISQPMQDDPPIDPAMASLSVAQLYCSHDNSGEIVVTTCGADTAADEVFVEIVEPQRLPECVDGEFTVTQWNNLHSGGTE